MDNKEIVVRGETATVQEIKQQVNLIQYVMRDVFKEGEHYGKIPGCGDKPALFKAGAEKLLMTFRLAPTYEEVSVVEEDAIISYRIRCNLTSQSGVFVGSGLGACNSKEKKYATVTIDEKKATDEQRVKALRSFKDNYGNLKLQVPANPWDVQNTLYKMACKRALVAACLNSLAASDIFTQDIEDDEQDGTPRQAKPRAPMPQSNKRPAQPPAQPPQPQQRPPQQQAPQIAPQAPAQPAAQQQSAAPASDEQEPANFSDNERPITIQVEIDHRDAAARQTIKEDGFKWDATKRVWYTVCNEDDVQAWKEKYPKAVVL